MGYDNEDANITALLQADGNIEGAFGFLSNTN